MYGLCLGRKVKTVRKAVAVLGQEFNHSTNFQRISNSVQSCMYMKCIKILKYLGNRQKRPSHVRKKCCSSEKDGVPLRVSIVDQF